MSKIVNGTTSRYFHVITTADTEELARKIAGKLVEEKLAAGVQISSPITSIYHWKNKIETATEYCCTITTRAELMEQVEDAIKELHPYEVPQIIALPIVAGSTDYLEWIDDIVEKMKA